MRKFAIFALTIGCFIMLYFTVNAAYRLLSSDVTAPGLAAASTASGNDGKAAYRLVVITQELDTPFWLKVKQGAIAAAEESGATLEMWGTYSSDKIEFLKQIEIAIASKVDGIIVQGLNSPEFTALTKIKAAGSGIPVITVATDVPMNDSLRRTYVGSDHLEAGRMLARQLVADMGFAGKAVLMTGDRQDDDQRLRLKGILDVLKPYPNIAINIVATGDTREDVAAATDDVLNSQPDTNAFLAISASHAGAIVQQIERRSRVEPYFLYSFDDSPETMTLLKQGKLDAIIAQSPETMGELSVKLMVDWLSGRKMPLDPEGYFTRIQVLRAEDMQ